MPLLQDTIISIISLLVGIVIGHVFTVYTRRPYLKVSGSGGGGGRGPGYYTFSTRITNHPGLIGISVGESRILGRKINSRIEKGLTVIRDTANNCSAVLIDKKTGEVVSHLWWKIGGEEYTQIVSIESGLQVDLMLMAKTYDNSLDYFPFDYSNDLSNPIKVPPNKISGTRKFKVIIYYNYGREKFEFEFGIKQSIHNRLSYEITNGGGGSFG